MTNNELVGIGLYTPVEAQRLLGVSASKVARWLRGHSANGREYKPLWRPQVELDDGAVYLGFRDLMEVRAANQFIEAGVSPQMVRKAIVEARKYINEDRPLSTTRFKTDGRTIFLEIAEQEGDSRLLDLLKRQYAFGKIMERSFKDVEFDGVSPNRWWVNSKRAGVVVDPQQSFGQPIEHETGIPTLVLAHAVKAEGSLVKAAKAWCVHPRQVERAVRFEQSIQGKAA
ncbi:MAG: hypothetical protein ACFB11_13675 [Paracoccaceae bacterium]